MTPPTILSDPVRLEAMLGAYLAHHPAVAALTATYRSAHRDLYLVGGAVRDLLLDRPVHELDFATDAHPDETERLLRRAGATAVYGIGARFGTIGGNVHDTTVEITTYRSETYRDGDRHPDVTFGTSLEGDLRRRDLTINAMAVDTHTGALFDYAGGRDDLAQRVVRVVGDAEERFREDPLRLMRVVRLATQLEFTIDPATAGATQTMAPALREVSRERVRDELTKVLLSAHPDVGVQRLADLRLLTQITPPIDAMRGMVDPEKRQFKDLFKHTMTVLAGTPPDLVLRLAALLHDVGKPRTYRNVDGEVHFFDHERVGAAISRKLLTELRYDSDVIQGVVHLIDLHMRPAADTDEWTDKAVRRFIVDVGVDNLETLFLLARSDITSSNPRKVAAHLQRLERLRERCQRWLHEASVVKPQSPLDGHDLMDLFGGKQGPWIGKVKQYLLDLVVDGDLTEGDKETARQLASAFVRDRGLLSV